MLPKQHAAWGAAAALALAPLLRGRSITLWASSVLFDSDHYVWYALNKRDLSPVRAYRYFIGLRNGEIKHDKGWWHDARPLHGPYTVAVLGLLALRWRTLRPVFLGVLFHSLLDAYAEHRLNAFLPPGWRATG